MQIPESYLEQLGRKNKSKVLNATALAEDLFCLISGETPVNLVGNGGVLTYVLLSKLGYKPDFSVINVKRVYQNGKPAIYQVNGNSSSQVLMDDVIASGETVNSVIDRSGILNPDVYSLMISGDTRSSFREKEGSTVRNTRNVYSARIVRSENGFPAIFSSRFLLKGVRDNPGYRSYLSKYVDTVSSVLGALRKMDLTPFELLEREPEGFIKEYGG